MLVVVSISGAVSVWRLIDNLSLKLGNLHVNQWIYCHFHSHAQWCRFHLLETLSTLVTLTLCYYILVRPGLNIRIPARLTIDQ